MSPLVVGSAIAAIFLLFLLKSIIKTAKLALRLLMFGAIAATILVVAVFVVRHEEGALTNLPSVPIPGGD